MGKKLRSELFSTPKVTRDDNSWTMTSLISLPRCALGLLALSLFIAYHYSYRADALAPRKPLDVADAHTNRASFSYGARVIKTMTSESLDTPIHDLYAVRISHRDMNHLVQSSRPPQSMPEFALGLSSDNRALWFFEGTGGTLTVALPVPVVISKIQFAGHPVARTCLPRDVNIWGAVMPRDSARITYSLLPRPRNQVPSQLRKPVKVTENLGKGLLMGSHALNWIPVAQFSNVRHNASGCVFYIPDDFVRQRIPLHAIAFEFASNWGKDYTCVSPVGIYGT